MQTVFLSYSRRDYFFAEMLAIKLDGGRFKIWRDESSIRAGDDWRQSIDDGIKDSLAVIVALSESSAESPYVTYEWAYAFGMSKPVIPVKLSECRLHPRLEPTEYLDFSYSRLLPWDQLIRRLEEIEVEKEPQAKKTPVPAGPPIETAELDRMAKDILGYLNSRGFTMASFERLQQKITPSPSTEVFERIIESKPTLFRRARIKGGKPGIAKRVP